MTPTPTPARLLRPWLQGIPPCTFSPLTHHRTSFPVPQRIPAFRRCRRREVAELACGGTKSACLPRESDSSGACLACDMSEYDTSDLMCSCSTCPSSHRTRRALRRSACFVGIWAVPCDHACDKLGLDFSRRGLRPSSPAWRRARIRAACAPDSDVAEIITFVPGIIDPTSKTERQKRNECS